MIAALLWQGLIGVGFAVNPIVGVIAAIASFLVGLWGLFGNNMGGVIKAVTSLASWTGDLFRKTFNGLQFLIGGLLGTLLKDLWGKVKKVVTELGDLIGRAIELLKRVRDYLDRIYRDFVRPILNLLQHVRQLLLLLRLMHLKFADKLDKLVARAQVLITKPFLLIRGKINGILDVLEMILHPTGALKGGPLLWGIWQEIGSLARLLSMARLRGLTTATPPEVAIWKSNFSPDGLKTITALNASGKSTAEQDAVDDQVRKSFEKLYGGIL